MIRRGFTQKRLVDDLEPAGLATSMKRGPANESIQVSVVGSIWGFGDKKKNAPLPTGVITTAEGLELEVVTSCKYVGVWLDGTMSFSQHIIKAAG